jgi:tRNA(fMet)-specific endonuclease VapC
MASIVLDTNAFGELMLDQPVITAKVSAFTGDIYVPSIVRGEIMFGLQQLPKGKRRTNLQSRSQKYLVGFLPLPVSEQVADKYGDLKARLRRQGVTMADNDLLIAASVLVLNATLITQDKAFGNVPGLAIEDWTV